MAPGDALSPDLLTGCSRRPAVAGVKGMLVLERGAVFWLLMPGSRDAWGCAARM
jgi:hypothetical protein